MWDIFGSDEMAFHLHGVQYGSSAIVCKIIEEVAMAFINRQYRHLWWLVVRSDVDISDTQQLSRLAHTVGRTARTPTRMMASTEVSVAMPTSKATHRVAGTHERSPSVPASSISRYRLRIVTSLTFAAAETADCVT